MKNNAFWIKTLSLVLIVGSILFYSQAASAHKQVSEANAALESYADQIAVLQSKQKTGGSGGDTGAAAGAYTDGTYTGSGQGYGGAISVKVIVKGGALDDIQVTGSSGESASYFNSAVSILDAMLDAQTWDVDAVSGATLSSNGLRNAVRAALEKAAPKERS